MHERIGERRVVGLDTVAVIEPQLELVVWPTPNLDHVGVGDREHEHRGLGRERQPALEHEAAMGWVDPPAIVRDDVDVLERPRSPRARAHRLDAVERITRCCYRIRR
jgi:hypothetical protein